MPQLSVKETAQLLGVTETRLANWRRVDILKDGKNNVKWLPAIKEPGSTCVVYDTADIISFLKREENKNVLEYVIAGFVPSQVRAGILNAIFHEDLPELPGIDDPVDIPPPTLGQMLDQSAWANFGQEQQTPQETA